MFIFKGNTLLKTIESDEKFSIGDKLDIKIFDEDDDKVYYNNIIIINNETNTIDLEIKPSITELFPCKILILQIKLIDITGYIKTNQYKLIVKRCK